MDSSLADQVTRELGFLIRDLLLSTVEIGLLLHPLCPQARYLCLCDPRIFVKQILRAPLSQREGPGILSL